MIALLALDFMISPKSVVAISEPLVVTSDEIVDKIRSSKTQNRSTLFKDIFISIDC